MRPTPTQPRLFTCLLPMCLLREVAIDCDWTILPHGRPRSSTVGWAANGCNVVERRCAAMGLHSYGVMGVDWEERVRYDRLREERLARITALLAKSELGALLCFDMSNIRHITATRIGTEAADKLNRFCLLAQVDERIMWDFGSVAS